MKALMLRACMCVLACAALSAQQLVWEHLGGMRQYRIIFPATPMGDMNGDGVVDIAQLVERFEFVPPGFIARYSEVWFLSGKDGSVLRVRPAGLSRRYHMITAAGDLDGDGTTDYACTHRPNGEGDEIVEIASGRNDRRLSYTTRKSVAWWGTDLASKLDVNSDGHPDVVITHPGAEPYGEVIVMSGATGRELYTIRGDPQFRYEFNGQCVDKLGDVDSDGCDDFVVGVLDAVQGVSGAAVHSGRTGQRLLIALADQWPQEAVGAGVGGASDLDGDGKPDFFASSHGHLFERGLVIAFSSATGLPIRMWWGGTQTNSGFGNSWRVCDVDRDGVSDLVIATSRLLDVTVYSGRDGTELVTVPLGSAGIEWVETVVDPGVDGFPRLLAMQPNYGLYRWSETFSSQYRGRTQLYRSVPAGVHVSGQGCMGTMGSEPRIGWRRQDRGSRVHLSNVPAGSTGVLLLGLSTRQWGSVPLPLSLDPYGFPGCVLGTSVDAALSVATGAQGLDRGYAFADVPQDLAQPGAGAVRVFAQWMVLSPTGGGASSQLVEWWVRE